VRDMTHWCVGQGMCVYNRCLGRWKMFGDVAQENSFSCTALRYTLPLTAKHCNTLQHTATHCNTLQYSAILCNTLQHSATICNTLQHTFRSRELLLLHFCKVVPSSYSSHDCISSLFTTSHTILVENSISCTALKW